MGYDDINQNALFEFQMERELQSLTSFWCNSNIFVASAAPWFSQVN